MQRQIEILWHGRGGQGVVTAAELTANAAFEAGFKGINVVPSFGAERRGAPVNAYLRLSNKTITTYSKILKADYIVIFDDSLYPNLSDSLIKIGKTVLIINTKNKDLLDNLKKSNKFKKIGIINAYNIAKTNNLKTSGNLIINTPIIGAFLKTSKLIELEHLKKSYKNRFNKKQFEPNFKGSQMAFANTEVIYNGY